CTADRTLVMTVECVEKTGGEAGVVGEDAGDSVGVGVERETEEVSVGKFVLAGVTELLDRGELSKELFDVLSRGRRRIGHVGRLGLLREGDAEARQHLS